MKRILKIISSVILAILIAAGIYIYFSAPNLPENSKKVIREVLAAEIPEFVKGEAAYIENNGVKVWYESIEPGDSIKGTLLLFMGISNDALGWPQTFLDKLSGEGYRVIRYDYRGTGFSDWMDNWKDSPYSLKDLAIDAKIILDSLEIKNANLLGVSMGGMVAQEFAINFPERTNTLISIMSSGNIVDEELAPMSTKIIFELIKAGLKYGIIPTDKNVIKQHLAAREALKGEAKYKLDVTGNAQQILYNIKMRKSYNSDASAQHHEATYRSGSRYEKLKELSVPVLIMHGKNDPLIPIEHSKKLAEILPNAKTKWFENMGHDIPINLEDAVCHEIFEIIDFK